jgi:DNA-binding response OmpR family regulator
LKELGVTYRILMIDDDREMLTLGRLILEREGFEVISVNNGLAGLEILNQENHRIDLVLLDIMMLGMDGWQVLQLVRNNETLGKIPVIMLTARHYLENEAETSSYAGLFDGYVVKPFVVKDLIGKIKGLLGRANGDAS